VARRGAYNFDENGDGLRGYNVVKNGKGKIVFIKPIDFWCNDFGGFDDLILKYFADSRMIDVLSSQRYSLLY